MNNLDLPYLTKDQVNEILLYAKTASCRDYLLIRLLWVTGVRVSECLAIRPCDIYYEIHCINVPNLKHIGNRLVFFDEKTEKLLQNYIITQQIKDNKPIFPITRVQVFYIVKKYGNMMGVDISPHIFRHSFTTFAAENGVAFRVIQKILGHIKSNHGTLAYLHYEGNELYQEYAKLRF
jgi:integrase